MQPFAIAISDADIANLKARLAATRFPEPIQGASDGIDPAFLEKFVHYWRTEYDWRATEARFNGLPQFMAEIDGEAVHLFHVKGRGSRNIPLLLTNGWPSNFVELLPLIPLLTEPIDGVAFDIVLPSLPGYGFSGKPTRPGMNHAAVAPLWAGLMTQLGYDKFLASGSDMGAGVVMALVRDFPDRLIGAHYVNVYYGFPQPEDPSAAEQAWLGRMQGWMMSEGAYAMEHGTKPATLAVGLNDSPAGLAAWILEKFHAWSDNDGDIETAFALEDLASIVSIYWFTQTIFSSIRLYKEAFADYTLAQKSARHDVPHGVLAMLAEDPAPREWGERNLWNIVRWTEQGQGGHFPALEVPEAMAHELRAFYSQIA